MTQKHTAGSSSAAAEDQLMLSWLETCQGQKPLNVTGDFREALPLPGYQWHRSVPVYSN